MSAVIWSGSAKVDLWTTGEYWSLHSPARTGEIANRINQAADFLVATSHAGTPFGRAEKWRVRGTDYILIYRSINGRLDILRVHHARQNWREGE